MEYYVALSGEKVGPLTQFKLVEMLRDGEVSADQKVWHRGMDGWLPISEVPSLKPVVKRLGDREDEKDADPPPLPDPVVSKKRVAVATEVRPLTRFWARYFDYTIVAVLVVIFSDFEMPPIDPELSIADLITRYEEIFRSGELRALAEMQFYALLMWHVIEGIMISVFGTTPGKALFGIHVVTGGGSKVPVLIGIYRSFLVYILGLGLFYFPLITFVTMALSFFRLLSHGICPWDQLLKLRVKHPPLSFGRILLAVAAFITLMTLQYLNFS
ncbi:MAG: RDD family protein [Verrucomicrobiales bacterium]|nr:RDD family protein [Verrucomicrobiales bacterium]